MEEEVKIEKTDRELIEERIAELEKNIKENRHTGKSYRKASECIDQLLSLPIGSQVLLSEENEKDNSSLIKIFVDRMRHDFSDINFKLQYPKPGITYAVRMSETYQETAKKRLDGWKKKLNEMK